MNTIIDNILPSLTAFYLDLHRHPELSGAEVRTSAAFAERLRAAGLEVITNIGGYGVLGVLRNGIGPTVMIRAELDALPIEERTGLAYASPGAVMHACGHDAHLACAAGAAEVLAAGVGTWSGTVMVVGQPAEEALTGAAAMLADGLYAHAGRPDVVLAQHVAPLPAGLVAHAAGPVTAGSVGLDVVIHGRGGHAAMPHLVRNPIPVAAAVILALGSTAGCRPEDGVVVTVGAFNAGNRGNVIPDTATLMIGIRSFDPAALDRAVAAIEQVAADCAAAADCPAPPSIAITSRSPIGVNEPDAAEIVRAAHVQHFGTGRVVPCSPSMATEDFPLFGLSSAIPTVYWMTGSVGPRQWGATVGDTAAQKLGALPPNHSSEFAPEPVPTLRTGTAAMVAAILGFLHTHPATTEQGELS